MKTVLFFALALAPLITFSQTGSVSEHYTRGVELMNEGGLENIFEANKEFTAVLKADPENIPTLNQLVLLNLALKDTAAAIRKNFMAVKLGDSDARRYGMKVLHQKFRYADTVQNILSGTKLKFGKLQPLHVKTVSELAKEISSLTTNPREKLQLFLLWSYKNITPDSTRFFDGSTPMDARTAFSKRTGLCEELSGITNEFCNAIGVRAVNVYGYTRYADFHANDKFEQFNHAWNLVKIDTGWYAVDLLWSITELQGTRSDKHVFHQRLQTDYFLALPTEFMPDHIPGDPVFQFMNSPRPMDSFTSVTTGINGKLPRIKKINYKDSLMALLSLPVDKFRLRVAEHAYAYNPSNPNDLIVELYNAGVAKYNQQNVSRSSLLEAKKLFQRAQLLSSASKLTEIKYLGETCRTGAANVDRRLLGVPAGK